MNQDDPNLTMKEENLSNIDLTTNILQESFSFGEEVSEVNESLDWQLRTGLTLESLCGVIEALIFMSDRPISLTKIKSQIDPSIPLRFLHECLTKLQDDYEKPHHGIRLVEVAEGYQFRTRPTYSKYVQNLFKGPSLTLGPSSLEVLAIIAYKQPISRPEIDSIRGVDSSHHLRVLMDKRLVSVNGRSDDLGRPVLYGTTTEFLEVFNLKNLHDLPPEHELSSMAQMSNISELSEIRALMSDNGGKIFSGDELSELDELSRSIQAISADTDFLRGLNVENKRVVEGEGAPPKKSAFDLLEEFLARQEISNQNKLSLASPSLEYIVQNIERTIGPAAQEVQYQYQYQDQKKLELAEIIDFKQIHDILIANPMASDGESGGDEEEWEEVFESVEASQEMVEEYILDNDNGDGVGDELDKVLNKAKDLDLDLSFLREKRKGPGPRAD